MWLNDSSHGAFVQITQESESSDEDITFVNNVIRKISDINIYRALVAEGLNVSEVIGMPGVLFI